MKGHDKYGHCDKNVYRLIAFQSDWPGHHVQQLVLSDKHTVLPTSDGHWTSVDSRALPGDDRYHS